MHGQILHLRDDVVYEVTAFLDGLQILLKLSITKFISTLKLPIILQLILYCIVGEMDKTV